MPQATSAAAISSVAARSSAGSCGIDDRVEVGEEEQALAAGFHRVLHPHPVADRAEVVAEVEGAGRLDAGNDAHDDGLKSEREWNMPECPGAALRA